MARNYIIPGAEFINKIRTNLSKLEMEFAGPEPADPMGVSLLLTSIANNQAYLEGALCHELSTGAAVDISQL